MNNKKPLTESELLKELESINANTSNNQNNTIITADEFDELFKDV